MAAKGKRLELEWDEALAPTWDPQRWTIKNLCRRLSQRADPWS